MASYPDPPPVIPLPESIAAQAAYQLRYENTEYYSWVSSVLVLLNGSAGLSSAEELGT